MYSKQLETAALPCPYLCVPPHPSLCLALYSTPPLSASSCRHYSAELIGSWKRGTQSPWPPTSTLICPSESHDCISKLLDLPRTHHFGILCCRSTIHSLFENIARISTHTDCCTLPATESLMPIRHCLPPHCARASTPRATAPHRKWSAQRCPSPLYRRHPRRRRHLQCWRHRATRPSRPRWPH